MDIHLLNDALRSKKIILLGAKCRIRYSGRAESFLESGDRVILIKPDGTLLVHQPKGATPINYMKEGSSHMFLKSEKGHMLKSRHLANKEYLDIELLRTHFSQTADLSDEESLQLAGSEKDMAMMIFSSPELIEKGFKPLSREEHTKFGFIDVFGYDASNTLVVIECKRYIGDPKAVDQLRRYVDKIKETKGLEKVRGILACPKLSPRAAKMLETHGFEYRTISAPKYLERYSRNQKVLTEYSESEAEKETIVEETPL